MEMTNMSNNLDCKDSGNMDTFNDNDVLERAANPAYLVIDYGEKLARQIQAVRDELQKEILSLAERSSLMWEVLRSFMIFITPITLGMIATNFASSFLPRVLAPFAATLLFGLTVTFLALYIQNMNDAISAFLNHRLYLQEFKDCQRHKCIAPQRKQGTPSSLENGYDLCNNAESSSFDRKEDANIDTTDR
ncbi:hypothetical protein ACJMK2_034676 [Sinanodonta woodiana]|uniref:Uncharacterized protein n=1 Tax=Sinanodonta woodiana TaxID=1069815 RepID=A0ABD3WWH0_SINWO